MSECACVLVCKRLSVKPSTSVSGSVGKSMQFVCAREYDCRYGIECGIECIIVVRVLFPVVTIQNQKTLEGNHYLHLTIHSL